MVIFDFKNINWGPDDAKGDFELQNYFLRTPDFDKLIEGKKRFVIGRKGTGKTAILQKIMIDAQNDPLIFCKELTLKEFPITDLRSLRDKSMQDKSQFVNIWSFLILIELVKLALQDEGAKNIDTYVELRDFMEENFPNKTGGFADTVKVLKSRQAKVSISQSLFGGEVGRGISSERETKVHYSKVIRNLKEQLAKVNTKSSYFILFDELDEGYKVNDVNKRLLLLSLFRAVQNLAINFSNTSLNFRPVVALRSDIFDNLEDNDLNKYDDYLIRLDWHSMHYTNYSLRELVNVRVIASLKIRNERLEPWKLVVEEKDTDINVRKKSLWKYIQNRTFDRPRDTIKYLKYCTDYHREGKLEFKTVLEAEVKYSNWLYRELRDEIQSHFPVWKTAMSTIHKIGNRTIKKEDLIIALDKEVEIRHFLANSNKDVDYVIKQLFDFGVLGNIDENGRRTFKYKDNDFNWASDKKLVVHFGFHKKFKLDAKY